MPIAKAPLAVYAPDLAGVGRQPPGIRVLGDRRDLGTHGAPERLSFRGLGF